MKDEGTDRDTSAAEPGHLGPPWLTVESGLYILLVLVAAVLRFYALGDQPLQEKEAHLALDAWRFYSGGDAAIRGHSPLLFHGNVLLYLLFGASDYVTRVLPALAGTLLVVLPYLLRPQLGRRAALVAAGILTFSPSFVYFSRQLNGDIIVAAASVAMVAGLFGYASQKKPRQLYMAAGALAVSLLAGGATLVTLLTLGGFFLVPAVYSRVRGTPTSSPVFDWFGVRSQSDIHVRALGLLGGVTALLATGFLVNLHGIQATLDLLSQWLGQFPPTAGGQPWHYYLSLFVAYELPLLIFGLVGVFRLRRRDAFSMFLLTWAGASLVLYSLMGDKPPSGILFVLVPLVFLAGKTIADLWQQVGEGEQWLWARLALVISIPAVFHLIVQMAAFGDPDDPSDTRHLVLVLLSVFFLFCVVLITGVLSTDWRTSLRCGGLVILITLGALTVHTTWRLNYHLPGNPQEIIVEMPTSRDVSELVKAIEEFSNQQQQQRHSIAVTVTGEEDPLLAWYLRAFPDLSFVSGVLSTPTPVVITSMGETQQLPGYRGARFRVQSSWIGADLPAHDLVNWFLFRQSLDPPLHREVALWLEPALDL